MVYWRFSFFDWPASQAAACVFSADLVRTGFAGFPKLQACPDACAEPKLAVPSPDGFVPPHSKNNDPRVQQESFFSVSQN
jgi:hypothetical protein